MAQKYAKDQPAGFTNRIERVAIIGAGGSVGMHIAQELVKTGMHKVTALTRVESKSKLPDGVKAVHINYDDEATLVDALKGQQFLIITMSVFAPPGTESKLVQAAAKAGIPYVMPNSYGFDISNESLAKEALVGEPVRKTCAEIEATGVSSWVALICSYWYEFSLICGPEWFGFDFAEKKVTFYDDGNTRINISTWEQCGRAVAAFLSLKELPEDSGDQSPTISCWRNKPLYVSSFLLSQKDMFESWKRATGETDDDWTINYEPTGERYQRGIERFQAGDRKGMAQAMYSRVFYPNGDGNYGEKHGLANGLLGLPEEDLDECTKRAKGMMDSGYSYYTRLQ